MGPSNFALIDAFVRGMLVALLLVLAKTLMRHRQAATVRVALALDLGLIVQAIGSMPVVERHVPATWQAPLVAVAVGNAVLFYVFARTLLDDRPHIGPRHAVAWLAAAAIGWLRVAWGPALPAPLFDLLCLAQRLLPTVIACAVVVLALRRWKDDLVEARRSLRAYIVGVGALYSIVQMMLRLRSVDGRLDDGSAMIDIALMGLLVGGIAWRLLRVAPDELLDHLVADIAGPSVPSVAADGMHSETAPPRTSGTDPAPVTDQVVPHPGEAEDARAIEALRSAMQARMYLQEGLSLGALAQHLGVAEYRLRRVIHQQLGFRHFSTFVNSFRLSHARAALSDPARSTVPILDIALEAGFGSIGPFNRAFRATEGVTPTEFRRRALADS